LRRKIRREIRFDFEFDDPLAGLVHDTGCCHDLRFLPVESLRLKIRKFSVRLTEWLR
jgi:hypothetical protein